MHRRVPVARHCYGCLLGTTRGAWMNFCVIGHRGAAGHAPENTMAAFACAQRMGLSDVELDVRLSRDGVLVLFNGASLGEKTPLVGRVEDYEVVELVQADVGRWFDAVRGDGSETHAGETLTTLVDVVARFGASLRYHVELKGASRSCLRVPWRCAARIRRLSSW